MANPWDADPILKPAAQSQAMPWENDPIVTPQAPQAQAAKKPAAPDFSGSYNTALDPAEEAAFQQWAGPKTSDLYDYDLRGAWKSGAAASENGHLPDTFKKPNHPTFSKESQYSNDKMPGGEWIEQKDGKFSFKPSPYNLQVYGKDALTDYFTQNEPDASLDFGQPASKQFSGSFLPLSRDAEGNVSFDSNAGLLGPITRAFMLPGDAMAGKVDPMSQEGINRAGEFASIFGPTSPAMGTGKAIAANAPVRERPGMDVAAAADRLGVPVPRAATSDSATVQQAGKIVSNVPIAGTPIRVASGRAIDELGNAATRVEQGYGSGSVPAAGAAAREGITDYSTKTLPGRVKAAYDTVDGLITQNVVSPLSETAKVAADISARRANAALPESGAVRTIQKALEQKDGLNYQGIKDLRTSVGEMLDNPQAITASGMSQAELKRIYGGLTDDLKAAVARSGGEKASAAFEAANQLAAKTAREREGLQKVLGRDASDERIFDRITAMAGSSTRADRVALARVRGAVSDETWNELASGVISKLGRNAEGGFSADRFVTGWGKLSPEGKSALFGGKKELASALDDIALVSSRFKQLNQYANPSGTGQTLAGAGYLSGAFLDPVTVIGSLVSGRVLSSVLSKPTSARALAAYAKAYERQISSPSKVNNQAFINTARAASAFLANEAGNKGLASQLFPALTNVQRVPANDGGQSDGVQENQSNGVTQELPMLLPNET